MKRLFLFLTVAAAVCCAACSDDPEVAESNLSLLEDNVTFDMFGGRSVLEITADSPWTVLRRRLVPHQRRRRFAHEEDRSDGRPEFPARGAHDRGAFLRRGRREAHRDRDAGEVRADPRAGGGRRRYNRLRRRERTGPEPACIRGMENRGRDRLVRRVAVRRDEKFGRETVADRRRRGRASAQRDADRLLRDGGRRTAAGDRRAAVDRGEYGRGPGG